MLLICVVYGSERAFAQTTPYVTSISASSTSVQKFKKYELDIQISKTYPADSILPYYYYDSSDTPTADPGRNSPYGVDGISVDAHFTSPSGKTFKVPAFYYQDFQRTGSYSTSETMTPTNNYSWKVRFTPSETGTYKYYLTIEDKTGITRHPVFGELNFSVTSSSQKGFVRVSGTDSRFLEFDDGTSFVPVGSGRQWWLCCGKRSWDYENTFALFGANGVNFTRIWDQNDGYGLTTEGHYDAYSYPYDFNPVDRNVDLNTTQKGTQLNQRGNYEEDKIIEAAEKNGIYIQITSHGDPYWIWDGATYNESWNSSPQAFDSLRHINYWKRNFRYRVARWGYSPSVLAWEAWNEHGHVLPNSPEYRFYQAYSQYQLQVDPYKHLRTTSQGSQAYSPAFWSSGFFDIANYHNYMMDFSQTPAELKYDEANFIYRTAWCLRDITKSPASSTYCSQLGLGDGTSWAAGKGQMPWIWGEFDAGTANWNEVNPLAKSGEGRVRMLHNSMWAGLFSPLGTTPLDWYWDQEDSATTAKRYEQRKAAKEYFSGVNYDGSSFTFLMGTSDAIPGYTGETLTVSNPVLRAYGMRSSDKKNAYIWVQNRNNTWYNSANSTAAVSGTVTIRNLLQSAYTLEIWNTYTGQKISTTNVTPVGGSVGITVNALSNDFAVKLINGNTSPTPTPTPVPTATPTPTPTPKPAQ